MRRAKIRRRLADVQRRYDAGETIRRIARDLGVKHGTLYTNLISWRIRTQQIETKIERWRRSVERARTRSDQIRLERAAVKHEALRRMEGIGPAPLDVPDPDAVLMADLLKVPMPPMVRRHG